MMSVKRARQPANTVSGAAIHGHAVRRLQGQVLGKQLAEGHVHVRDQQEGDDGGVE